MACCEEIIIENCGPYASRQSIEQLSYQKQCFGEVPANITSAEFYNYLGLPSDCSLSLVKRDTKIFSTFNSGSAFAWADNGFAKITTQLVSQNYPINTNTVPNLTLANSTFDMLDPSLNVDFASNQIRLVTIAHYFITFYLRYVPTSAAQDLRLAFMFNGGIAALKTNHTSGADPNFTTSRYAIISLNFKTGAANSLIGIGLNPSVTFTNSGTLVTQIIQMGST